MSSPERFLPEILCGGPGTRFWVVPLKTHPEQYAPLVGDESPLQLTLERVSTWSDEIVKHNPGKVEVELFEVPLGSYRRSSA